jgi:hypothetical protein
VSSAGCRERAGVQRAPVMCGSEVGGSAAPCLLRLGGGMARSSAVVICGSLPRPVRPCATLRLQTPRLAGTVGRGSGPLPSSATLCCWVWFGHVQLSGFALPRLARAGGEWRYECMVGLSGQWEGGGTHSHTPSFNGPHSDTVTLLSRSDQTA